jgi:hypothetical protein
MEAGSGPSADVRRLATAVATRPNLDADVAAWSNHSDFPYDMGRHQIEKMQLAAKHGNEVARLTQQLDRLEKAASSASEKRVLAIRQEIAEINQKRDEEWALLKQSRENDSPERLLAELMGRQGVITRGERTETIEALAVTRREFDSLDPATRSGYAQFLGGQALVEVELMDSEAADFYPAGLFEADFIRLRQFTGYVLAESGVDFTGLLEAS